MLKQGLERRSAAIKRRALLQKISFGPVEGQHFAVYAWWKGGEFIKRYEWDDCFKVVRGRPTPVGTPCQMALKLVQEILTKRGI